MSLAAIVVGYASLISLVGPWALLLVGLHIVVMLAAIGQRKPHGRVRK